VIEATERLVAPPPGYTDDEYEQGLMVGIPIESIRFVDAAAFTALVDALKGDA
jgi:hypothetical protein